MDMSDKVIFRLKRAMGKWTNIYGSIKNGDKTSEWRDATDYWRKRLVPWPKTAWFTHGYPKGNVPRLEADIIEVIYHEDTNQYEIKVENVIEIGGDRTQNGPEFIMGKVPEAVTKISVPEEFKPLLEDLRGLVKDGDNPNKMTKSVREALWRSLKKFGWIKPIVVDDEGTLADGEQKLETCLSHDEFYGPVLRINVDDKDRRLLRQVANKLSGKHDKRKDLEEYKRIIESQGQGDLIKILQVTEKDLIKAMADPSLVEAEEGPDLLEVDTDIMLGDVYILGTHRLICGDATIPAHVEALMKGDKLDVFMSDPPYGINVVSRKEGKIGGDKAFGKVGYSNVVKAKAYVKIEGDDKPFDPTHLLELAPIQVLFGANYYSSKLPDSPGWMVWDKNAGREWEDTFADAELIYTNSKKHTRVYRVLWKGMIKDPEEGARIHPTQKPVKLLKLLLADFSKPGDKVGDFYGGSGSQLIACEVLERPCYMMEIVPEYCQLIINRWEAYTGGEALKEVLE